MASTLTTLGVALHRKSQPSVHRGCACQRLSYLARLAYPFFLAVAGLTTCCARDVKAFIAIYVVWSPTES